jgi:hypothetical protein
MVDEIRPGRMGDFYSFNSFNEALPHDSFFLFCSDAHITNYSQHLRVDADEYIMSVFFYVPVDSVAPH